jgi:hypothetical protein
MSNLDFNTADEQRVFDIIPNGTICTLQMTVRPGGAGDGGWLKMSKAGGSEALDCEFIVVDGEFAKRRLWQLYTLQGTTPGHAEAGKISRNILRAILESARGIEPSDISEAAQAARKASSWGDFANIRFLAKVGVQAARDGYDAKNTIKEVITPDRSCWKQVEQLPPQATTSGSGAAPTPAAPAPTAHQPANPIVRPEWTK